VIYDSELIHRRAFLLTPLALLAAERKPNIVLIVARGWRGQATPWASDPDIQAPNLAKFAQEALVFPRAYAASPRPGPARAAIATGRFPHVNGAIRDGAPLRTEEVTIDAVLRAGGYHTGTGIEFLQSKPAAPFLADISLDPPRFSTPADAARLHLRDNIPTEAAAKARESLAKYYGSLAAMDEQLGKILSAVPENTIAVFTSDCGVELGSHGMEGDDVPFEESVRIPLAIRYPQVLTPAASDLLVSQVDLLPTLIALCGEPAFEGIQGRDLSPLLTGAKGDRPESIFAEGRIGSRDEWRMLLEGIDKIVVDANGTVLELYNLAADPYELKNRAADPSVELKRDQLLAVLRATRSKLLDFRRRPG
jgi:arylsulfatase A-like enzyme